MSSSTEGMKIGILTAGGDCPGLNAAIRGVGKTAIVEYGMTVYGISSGFLGLLEQHYHELHESELSGILTLGGTILGTSRVKPFKKDKKELNNINKPELIKKHYAEMGLDALVCMGGNGTMRTASKLAEAGLNIIGLPKTIDNDVWGTDRTFGFDTAVQIATDAIDRLHSTANSHKRIMVIEVMGHHAGWLALYSGIAGGGDVILIPEIPYDGEVVSDYLLRRAKNKKPYSIVVVAEGINHKKSKTAAQHIGDVILENTGLETRQTILGYIQRGGSPSPADRLLATRYGASAVEMISRGEFGVMVALRENKITGIPLSDVADKLRTVPPDHYAVANSRKMDVCFGDSI